MLPTNFEQDQLSKERIGYVVKRYPRFSETFIVNEILALEAVGTAIDIFALRPSVDTHFQNAISQVRAPVTYLPTGSVKSSTFWRTCHKEAHKSPNLWLELAAAEHATVMEVYQGVELAKHTRANRLTHLHAHFATSAATVARIAARLANIPYSITMHAKDIFHESVIYNDLKTKIADAQFIVTVSDFNFDYLTSGFGNASKIHRIYNGLNLELFDFQPKTEPTRKIVSVGRLVEKKGFEHLIDACMILKDKAVEFDCEIVGTGELEASLRQRIDSLGLLDQVHLVGPQPQNIVREMIRSAAVFAAPCVVAEDGNRDGLPTVITESLALGTPCVATDVTGIPEIVRHEETGIIVSQANAEELAVQLERLLEDASLANRLAVNARQLIEEEFDVQRNVGRLRNLFTAQQSVVPRSHLQSIPQGV